MTEQTLARLQEQQQQYRQRIEALQRDLTREYPADSGEQAQERENDEVMEALLLEARESLRQTESALQRLQDGSYGLCSGCGEKIAAARLEAMPDALMCIDCASRAEPG